MSYKQEFLDELDEAAAGEDKAVKQGSSDVKKPEATGGSAVDTIGGAKGAEGKIKQGSSDEKKPEGTPASGMTGSGGDTVIKQGSSDITVPTSKVGMINQVVSMLNSLKRDELSARFGKIAGAVAEDADQHSDGEVVSEEADATPRITSVDVSEDIAALIANDTSLTEEFKEKATTIFEAAIIARVNEQLQGVALDIEADVEAEKVKIHEELSSKLNDYLDYVTEQWLEENRLAVEQGLRSEIVTDFIGGLKNLFAENYIEIPEEREDVLESMIQHSKELEEKLNEQVEESIELRKQVNAYKQQIILSQVSESLTDAQKEKFNALAENVEFESDASYAKKLGIIKEGYFKGNTQALTESAGFDDEPVEVEAEEKAVPQEMRAYMNAISRFVKK